MEPRVAEAEHSAVACDDPVAQARVESITTIGATHAEAGPMLANICDNRDQDGMTDRRSFAP